MSLKKITAVTLASMMISAAPVMTVNAKSYEQKTETVTEIRNEERPAETKQHDPSFQPGEAPEMNGELPPMGEEMGPRPDDEAFARPEGTPPELEEGELPPEKPEGEEAMGMPEGPMNENERMAPPSDMEGMDREMPEMMEDGEERKPMDEMMPDMEFENAENEEEAKTIVSQIKSLFERLMNLFGNRKDMNPPIPEEVTEEEA